MTAYAGFVFVRARTWIAHGLALIVGSVVLSANVGFPPNRFYSLDDIGGLSPGFMLGFDPVGRVFLAKHNTCMVLNDSEWHNLLEGNGLDHAIVQVAFRSGEHAYFTSHGHWGKLVRSGMGRLIPESLSPAIRPQWTLSSEFDHILVVDSGVLFYNWNGLVYLDESTGDHTYIEVSGLEEIFEFNGSLYVSLLSLGIRRLDLRESRIEIYDSMPQLAGGLKDATPFGPGMMVFSHTENGLYLYDGQQTLPWVTGLEDLDQSRVVDICSLEYGMIAVAVQGKGIFILSIDKKVVASLMGPDYVGVASLASNEPGILWYSCETGVGKVTYSSPVRIVDHRSGLKVSWPDLCRWRDRVVIASAGVVYESVSDPITGYSEFRKMAGQPEGFNLSVGSLGNDLLVASRMGVFVRDDGTEFRSILDDIEAVRVVPAGDDLCYVIGEAEIAMLKRSDGKWVECAQRADGFGFPSVAHFVSGSVWIELGLNRVARVSYENSVLVSELFEEFPWVDPTWVNIGVIGDRVIMSGRGEGRLYYDESLKAFSEAPDLDALFSVCPQGVWRVVEDGAGNLWVSHIQGVSCLVREDEGFRLEFMCFREIKEPTPIIRIIDGEGVWVTSGDSLYYVESARSVSLRQSYIPKLIWVADAGSESYLRWEGVTPDLGDLDYGSNALKFQFFAGTYSLDKVHYHVEVRDSNSAWIISDSDSEFTLPNLREGPHTVSVRLGDSDAMVGEPLVVRFSILSPWFRTVWAYVLYVLGILFLAALISTVPLLYVKRRNKHLSRLVEARTRELREATENLRREEKNTAVHEERIRIANEVHDSVQQGLCGLKLMLESIEEDGLLPDSSKRKLNKAQHVLSFTQQEVKHAIWNMETPLLEGGDLRNALENMAHIVSSGSCSIVVRCEGAVKDLPSSVNHHLVRMAQEAITNAIRHGKATHLMLSLCYGTNGVVLKIADNGTGFRIFSSEGNGNQLGLRGIRNRARRINGTVDIESSEGEGTCICIAIPVK